MGLVSTASAVRAKRRDCGVGSQGSLPPDAVPQDSGDCASFPLSGSCCLESPGWLSRGTCLHWLFSWQHGLLSGLPMLLGRRVRETTSPSWGRGQPQQQWDLCTPMSSTPPSSMWFITPPLNYRVDILYYSCLRTTSINVVKWWNHSHIIFGVRGAFTCFVCRWARLCMRLYRNWKDSEETVGIPSPRCFQQGTVFLVWFCFFHIFFPFIEKIFFSIILFIYFQLCWVFVSVWAFP